MKLLTKLGMPFKFSENGSAILTGISMFGVVVTSALSVYGYARSDKDDRYEFKDYAKRNWKCYIPAMVSAAVTGGCMLASHKANAKQLALMGGALAVSDKMIKEYKDDIKELIGPEKEEEVRLAYSGTTLLSNPPTKEELHMVGKGQDIFYESITGQYFISDLDAVRSALYHFNRNFTLKDGNDIAELCDFLGIPIPEGSENLGWGWNYISQGFRWIDFDESFYHRFPKFRMPNGGSAYSIVPVISPDDLTRDGLDDITCEELKEAKNDESN